MTYHWNIETQISVLVTWSFFLCFILLWFYRTRVKSPLLSIGLLTLGSFVFSVLTAVEDIPDDWMIHGTWLLAIGIVIAPVHT